MDFQRSEEHQMIVDSATKIAQQYNRDYILKCAETLSSLCVLYIYRSVRAQKNMVRTMYRMCHTPNKTHGCCHAV